MSFYKKNRIVLLLFALTFFIGEVKYMLPLSTSVNPVHWVIFTGDGMAPIWFYHTWGKAINWIIIMYAVTLIARDSSKHIQWATHCYLIYRCLDLLMFFLCESQQEYYWIIYPTIIIYSSIIYYTKQKK